MQLLGGKSCQLTRKDDTTSVVDISLTQSRGKGGGAGQVQRIPVGYTQITTIGPRGSLRIFLGAEPLTAAEFGYHGSSCKIPWLLCVFETSGSLCSRLTVGMIWSVNVEALSTTCSKTS